MQQTNWQKTLEVVVKGFVAAIVGLAGLWVLGWVFTFVGSVLIGLAGIVVTLLKFLVPVAVVAAIVYFVVSQMRPNDTTTIETRGNSKPIDLAQAASVNTTIATPAPAKIEVIAESSTGVAQSLSDKDIED